MQDLTTGSITRHLLQTASYMLVTMVFQTLYMLVDLYWVGYLGKEAVAAVSVSGNLMFVVLAATQMLGVGTTTLIAHAAGRRDHAAAIGVFTQAQLLTAGVAALFFGVVFSLNRSYAAAFSADATTAALAGEFLRWFVPAMALQFPMVTMAAALRGTGNFRPGMIVQTATIIINIVLSPVLVFGWISGRPLGVEGAALASFIAVAIGVVWLACYFLPATAYLRFERSDWRPRIDMWKRMLGIGLPAGAEFALMSVYLSVVYAVSRPFGSEAQAGFGIGLRIIQSLFMPVVALSFAVAPLAGQNVGAGLRARVLETYRTAIGLGSAVMLLLAMSCQVVPGAFIRIFSGDPKVLAVGEEYLRLVSWTFVPSAVSFVTGSMFQAMGNTMPSLVASLVRVVVATIPVIVLSGMPAFELRWIWYLTLAAAVLQMTMSVFLVQREFRTRLVSVPAALTQRTLRTQREELAGSQESAVRGGRL
jgi:putative MATE family efflux protein